MSMLATKDSSANSELARMNFRLPQHTKDVIEQAAIASGQTVTAFAIMSLFEQAQRVLDIHTKRLLSDRDRDIFLALLSDDDEPNDALQQAARRYQANQHGR